MLKEPERDNYELIKRISEKTSKRRKNFSFATKFCHYMCFYLFEGEKEQDNFPVYDNVLEKMLPEYCKRYSIKCNIGEFRENYKLYLETIDEIINKAYEEYEKRKISRNGFDYLIWYFHKGKSM